MYKAKKLPSGSWRVNLYLGKDEDGKQVRKSITAKSKREVEQKALDYLSENHLGDSPMTVGDAVDKYIMDSSVSISPSTLRGYRKIQRNNISGIQDYMADRIERDDLQKWVNALARKYSPKTVHNIYGLVRSAIVAVRPNFSANVKLPAADVHQYKIPSNEDIKEMLDAANPELKKSIMLAAFCGLRRGEICYLRYKDIKDGFISIHGDTVKPESGQWVDKDRPKTKKSNRTVLAPGFVLEELGDGAPEEKVVGRTPDWITGRFGLLMKKLGMPYHFHLLRHYFASRLIAEGVPRTYVQSLGGWENGGSLDKVYTHILQNTENEYNSLVTSYFSKEFS